MTDAYPAAVASSDPKWSGRSPINASTVETKSQINAECAMSPKSTMPETRCSASNKQLSDVRSLWITWARRSPKTGSTCSSNRSSTSSTVARRAASGMWCTNGRSAGACLMFQSKGCPADGWKNPRRARPSRAHVTPNEYRVSTRSSSGSIVRPGSNVTIRTMCVRPSGPVTSAWKVPSRVGTSRITGSVGSVRATCSNPCVCMSITPVSSAGLPIFNTNPRPSWVVIGDVLVALADERRRDTAHAEDVRGGALGVPRRERGRRRLERVRLAGSARDVRGGVRHGSTTLDNRTSPPRAAGSVIDQEDAEAARFSSYIVAVASSIAR